MSGMIGGSGIAEGAAGAGEGGMGFMKGYQMGEQILRGREAQALGQSKEDREQLKYDQSQIPYTDPIKTLLAKAGGFNVDAKDFDLNSLFAEGADPGRLSKLLGDQATSDYKNRSLNFKHYREKNIGSRFDRNLKARYAQIENAAENTELNRIGKRGAILKTQLNELNDARDRGYYASGWGRKFREQFPRAANSLGIRDESILTEEQAAQLAILLVEKLGDLTEELEAKPINTKSVVNKAQRQGTPKTDGSKTQNIDKAKGL